MVTGLGCVRQGRLFLGEVYCVRSHRVLQSWLSGTWEWGRELCFSRSCKPAACVCGRFRLWGLASREWAPPALGYPVFRAPPHLQTSVRQDSFHLPTQSGLSSKDRYTSSSKARLKPALSPPPCHLPARAAIPLGTISIHVAPGYRGPRHAIGVTSFTSPPLAPVGKQDWARLGHRE